MSKFRSFTCGPTFPAYEIRVADEAAFYKYNVSIEVQEDFDVSQDLTDWMRETDDDYEQAGMCRDLVQTFFYKAGADVEEVSFAYDRRKALYTNRQLPDALMKPTTLHGYMMSLHVAQKLNGASATVTLKPENNNTPCKLRDLLTQEDPRGECAKGELRAFFECLWDEASLQSKGPRADWGLLYGEDAEFERGLVIRAVVCRGIILPDSTNKLEAPLYFVDVRKYTLYKDQTLAQSLREVADWFPDGDEDEILKHFLNLYRGVRCRLTYSPDETVTVEAYGREPRDIKITQLDGTPISMADYYRKKYNVDLADDTLPTIRMAGDTTEHPLDVLEVMPRQRVRLGDWGVLKLNGLLRRIVDRHRIEELKAHMDGILGPTSASKMGAFGVSTSYPTTVTYMPK